MADITRNSTLPDSADKTDFYNLVDTATVQTMKPATNSTTALKLANAAGTAILNVDSTNSRVGIGTTSPSTVLNVVGTVKIDESSNDDCLSIDNDGTGHGLAIQQDGNLASSQYALYVIAANAQSASPLVKFFQDDATTNQSVLLVENDGVGYGLAIQQDGVLGTTSYGLYVYSNAIQVTSDLVMLYIDNAASTVPVLSINNDGLGAALNIDCDGTHASTKVVGIQIDVDNGDTGDQIALDIDQIDEAKSYFARFNATTAWTSSKNPESDTEAGWVKIMVGTTAYFLPYYAAS